MRFLVFGAGAVGQAVGCILASDDARHTVDLVVRERFLPVMKQNGLHVTGLFGEFSAAPGRISAYSDIRDISAQSYDYVLVTTKSYDTANAIAALRNPGTANAMIVSMQNGCGNMEQFADVFGENRVLGARVITGFEIDRPGIIRITVSADDIHIGGFREGEMNPAAEKLAECIDHAGLPCTATTHVQRDLYAKLLYNCALNPLGAILGIHYGALADNSDSRGIMDAVIDEVFMIIEALGGKTHWDTPAEYRAFFYEQQVPATYNHRSSMLQDIEQGKPTEVDALTGWVGERGREKGIPTPVCDTVSKLVRFREKMSVS